MGVLLALALVARAAALDWWVPDPAAGARIAASLDRLWAGSEVTLRVGPPGPEGVWYADGRLVLVTGTVRREAAIADEPDTEVVLVRAWTRAIRVQPSPDRASHEPDRPAPWTPLVAVLAGPGLGVADGGAPVHAAVQGGASWRILEVGALLVADFGAALPSDTNTPVGQQRAGGGVIAGVRLPLWGGEYVSTVGPIVRLRATRDTLQPEVGTREVVVGGAERMNWWGRATPTLVVGVGLSATIDDLPDALRPARIELPNGRSVVPLPGQVAIEVGVAWRPIAGGP